MSLIDQIKQFRLILLESHFTDFEYLYFNTLGYIFLSAQILLSKEKEPCSAIPVMVSVIHGYITIFNRTTDL